MASVRTSLVCKTIYEEEEDAHEELTADQTDLDEEVWFRVYLSGHVHANDEWHICSFACVGIDTYDNITKVEFITEKCDGHRKIQPLEMYYQAMIKAITMAKRCSATHVLFNAKSRSACDTLRSRVSRLLEYDDDYDSLGCKHLLKQSFLQLKGYKIEFDASLTKGMLKTFDLSHKLCLKIEAQIFATRAHWILYYCAYIAANQRKGCASARLYVEFKDGHETKLGENVRCYSPTEILIPTGHDFEYLALESGLRLVQRAREFSGTLAETIRLTLVTVDTCSPIFSEEIVTCRKGDDDHSAYYLPIKRSLLDYGAHRTKFASISATREGPHKEKLRKTLSLAKKGLLGEASWCTLKFPTKLMDDSSDPDDLSNTSSITEEDREDEDEAFKTEVHLDN